MSICSITSTFFSAVRHSLFPYFSASVQIRALFEKAQNILRLYAQYTDPKSEEGSKLSPEEKERLLNLFLHELRIVIDQFGGRILIRVGGIIRKIFGFD